MMLLQFKRACRLLWQA